MKKTNPSISVSGIEEKIAKLVDKSIDFTPEEFVEKLCSFFQSELSKAKKEGEAKGYKQGVLNAVRWQPPNPYSTRKQMVAYDKSFAKTKRSHEGILSKLKEGGVKDRE